MSILPAELVHLIFEQIWDSLCELPGETYLIRPAPSTVLFVFGQLRLVCQTWSDLAQSKYIVRVAAPRPNPDGGEEEIGDLRACRVFELKSAKEEGEDAAFTRWQRDLTARTHVSELVLTLQNSNHGMSFIPVSTLAESQLQTMTDLFEELPEEQRGRVRKVDIYLEDEADNDAMVTGFIRGSTLQRLAGILPELRDLRLAPRRASELAEYDDGIDQEFWKGLRYLRVEQLDLVTGPSSAPGAASTTSTITRILEDSAATLREVVFAFTVFGTMHRTGSSLLDVFGSSAYPSLTKLHVLSPPPRHGSPVDDALFTKFPALIDLALTLSDTATPSFLSRIAPTLTHLTLELPLLNSLWSQALITFVSARGSTLRFLSVDLPESVVNDNGEGASRIVLKEMRLIMKVCKAYDVVLATSDERTWGGETDVGDGKQGLYIPEKEDKEADNELSSVGESEVEDEDDWDAEDWGIFRRRWSEEKMKSMALADVMERLRGRLKPSVNAEDVEQALGPLLLS